MLGLEAGVVLTPDIIAYRSNRGCQYREIMGGCREHSELQIPDLQGKVLDRDRGRGRGTVGAKARAKVKVKELGTISGSRCQLIDP